MRIYLSYPMTQASPADLEMRREVRDALASDYPGFEVYDPEVCEPAGMTMKEIQEHDFAEMRWSDGQLVIWSEGAAKSAGLLAEIEWARRIFQIPVVVVRYDGGPEMRPWTLESVGGRVFPTVAEAVAELERLWWGWKGRRK